jgi:hypothetical protein
MAVMWDTAISLCKSLDLQRTQRMLAFMPLQQVGNGVVMFASSAKVSRQGANFYCLKYTMSGKIIIVTNRF